MILCVHQGRVAVFTRMIDIEPLVDQLLHDVHMAVFSSIQEGRAAINICMVNISSLVDQQLHDVFMAFPSSTHEGRPATITRMVYVSARLKESKKKHRQAWSFVFVRACFVCVFVCIFGTFSSSWTALSLPL